MTTTLGVRTLNAAQEYDDDPLRTSEDRDDGERQALTTDIMLGATALLAIGTVLLLVLADWGGEDGDDPAVQVGLAPTERGALGYVGGEF